MAEETKSPFELGPCLRGSHPFERLAVIETVGALGDAAVRWCPMCAAIVVDVEQRGRTLRPGGIVRERIPEISRRGLAIAKGQTPSEERKPLDLDPCLKGSHRLERLAVMEMRGGRGDAVLRWCAMCGAVVVDIERNGRVVKAGGIAQQKIPEISRVALGLAKSQK